MKKAFGMIGKLLLILCQLALASGQVRIVDTRYGKLKGIIRECNHKQFTSFLGVPFAAPPVGALRFKSPQSHTGWGDTVRDALEFGPGCPQDPGLEWKDPAFPSRLMTFPEDEDCLLLNIYVPGDVLRVTRGSLPVVVFIHGGGFLVGSSRFELGDVFVTDAEPVVMVTIQYRLSVFGFLTSGDEVLPGNMGLKDQTFALRWVTDNIADFGGDPDKVTLCGESAGGESVLAHLISPMSNGLFQKASSQSAPASWLYPTKQRLAPLFRDFVRVLDCEGNSHQALNCLRTKSVRTIFNSTIPTLTLSQIVIDGKFITDEPRNLWANLQYNKADLMIGFTSDDGKSLVDFFTTFVAEEFDFVTNRSKDLEIMNKTLFFLLSLQLSDQKDWKFRTIERYGKSLSNFADLYTVIKARYYDIPGIQLEKARGVLDCARDNFFAVFSIWIANQIQKKNNTVRMYIFDHKTEAEVPGGIALGAPHTSELPFQFGYGFTDPDTRTMTDDELSLTHSLIQAWTSFATGDPSYLTMDGKKIRWPEYTFEKKNILIFDTKMSAESVRDGEQWQAVVDFWLAIDSLSTWERTPVGVLEKKEEL